MTKHNQRDDRNVFYYTVGTKQEKYPDMDIGYTIKTVWDENDMDLLAQEMAHDYHHNHDGWESSFPVTIHIYRTDKTFLGSYEVDREYDPVFTATEAA